MKEIKTRNVKEIEFSELEINLSYWFNWINSSPHIIGAYETKVDCYGKNLIENGNFYLEMFFRVLRENINEVCRINNLPIYSGYELASRDHYPGDVLDIVKKRIDVSEFLNEYNDVRRFADFAAKDHFTKIYGEKFDYAKSVRVTIERKPFTKYHSRADLTVDGFVGIYE